MHLGVLYLDNLWVLFDRLFYRELGGGQFATLHNFFLLPSQKSWRSVHTCFNTIRWQCLESFCWDAGFTWRLVVGKFGDMMLDLRL
jgi:hypothetical protein